MALPRRSGGSSSAGMGYADVSELEKYKLVSNIGKGSFGVISKVQRVEDGKEFALKQLDYSKMTEKDRKQILAEVAILESLKHRNIVQLIQKIKDPQNERIFIIMEYCTSGDLGSVIRKAQRSNAPMNEDKIWNIFLQIVLALHHCHWPAERPVPGQKGNSGRLSSGAALGPEGAVPRYQVLHRDLKPENVFLSDDFVKLGDFGLSKDMGTSAFTSTYVGTPLYMPPEILAENRYDTKSDIWSLGCLVFEMCALASPFSTAQTQAELITMVKSGKLPSLPANISPALKSVIKAMLNLNPVKRPNTRDLLEMDEMKLHRKLFTVQNQTHLLVAKKDELKLFDERLNQRAAALDEREKALAVRETSCQAREVICDSREEENKDTQKRLNFAAETLRNQWKTLREEKDLVGLGLPLPAEDKVPEKRPSAGPIRPALEERNTVPLLPVSRFPRNNYAAYGDTPSKIPTPVSAVSPVALGHGLPASAGTPLRRGTTRSLGNLAAEARAQAERDAAWAPGEATPAKQITKPYPGRLDRQRTSIGSPSEVYGTYCEDVSMASPMSIASPAPFQPRPRRSSVVPNGILAVQQYSTSSIPASTSASSTDSMNSESSATSAGSEGSSAKPAMTIPTMITAPKYVYREAATPAKWAMEDPDLPSPFIRRGSTAPLTAPVPFPIVPDRQPLGAIIVQSTTVSAPTHSVSGGKSAAAPIKTMPRSKSGNLHQHVLRTNAQAAAGKSGVENTAGGGGGSIRARTVPVGREAARPH